MSEATVVDNGLTDDHKRALQALAHIALGSMSHTIERYAANDLLNYMGELERQRTEARDALTARDEALASIRVFAQDCIENGYFDKGALGNLYSIRDLCDSKGEAK